MASIEFIQKRITGKEKELDKLTKKLDRINKAKASGWEDNPYYYSEHDLRYTLRGIEEAKASLEKYRADLAAANEKASSRNVPAITEFLEKWKDSCRRFYGNGLKKYYEESETVYALYCGINEMDYGSDEYKTAKEKYEAAYKAFKEKKYGVYETYTYTDRWSGRERKGERKTRDGEYEYLKPYSNERKYEDAMALLEKDLKNEADRKYDFIIERTNAIVGKITDASALKVGAKGDLNGYIQGDRGRAKVQTIGAGGYNIQCFHFRTLIHAA